MKRLPIIVLTLALCLLTAGCGAKPNEPDDGDSAKAEIVERMAAVKAAEIKYISSFFSREHVNAEDTASVLNAAAEHRSEQSGQGLDHYTMEIYLSGGPDAYNSSDEHFVFFAGLDAMSFIVIPALVIGLGFILYAQFKYNKGIF